MADNYWSSAGDTAWETDANWSLGHKPTTDEDVIFDNTSVVDCNTTGEGMVCKSLTVTSDYSGTFDANGNTLTASNGNITYDGTANPVFDGLVTVNGSFHVNGARTPDISGGITFSGDGSLDIDKAWAYTTQITVDTSVSVTCTYAGAYFQLQAATDPLILGDNATLHSTNGKRFILSCGNGGDTHSFGSGASVTGNLLVEFYSTAAQWNIPAYKSAATGQVKIYPSGFPSRVDLTGAFDNGTGNVDFPQDGTNKYAQCYSNGNTITCGRFQVGDEADHAQTIFDYSGSTINCASVSWLHTGSNATTDLENTTFNCSGYFDLNNTLPNLTVTGCVVNITGACDFTSGGNTLNIVKANGAAITMQDAFNARIQITAGGTVLAKSGVASTIHTYVASDIEGDGGGSAVLRSDSAGNAASITNPAGMDMSYVTFQDITASNEILAFTSNNCTDGTGNTNIDFNQPVISTCALVGNTMTVNGQYFEDHAGPAKVEYQHESDPFAEVDAYISWADNQIVTTINVLLVGNYNVRVTDENGETSTKSNAFTVTVSGSPTARKLYKIYGGT